MKIVKCLMLSLLFISSTSFGSVGAGGWNNVKIKKIVVHDNGDSAYKGRVEVYMFSEMPADSVPTCISNTAYKFAIGIDLSRPGAQVQYSTVLAAYMAGKKVSVALNKDQCVDGIPMLRNITIES